MQGFALFGVGLGAEMQLVQLFAQRMVGLAMFGQRLAHLVQLFEITVTALGNGIQLLGQTCAAVLLLTQQTLVLVDLAGDLATWRMAATMVPVTSVMLRVA